ncbi:MAG: two-component sensor histidine kinase, partial [Burkholderiales bacterium]|nr:two-component sensor histidine kinase [Burkholderiales bacterium]
MVVVSLFWRTFFLLAALLMGSMLAWLMTLRALDFAPRAIQAAQQIASQVNLSRAALMHTDPIARVSLIKAMAEQEGLRILPREPTDQFQPFDHDSLSERIAQELKNLLGPATVVARSVNGVEGLWIGFQINGDPNWLQLDRERFNPASNKTWVIWLLTIGG